MVNKWPTIVSHAGPACPNVCFLCGAYTGSRRLLCDPCQRDLGAMEQACYRCGRPMLQPGLCPGCTSRPSQYDHAVIPFHYSYPVSLLIKLLKYKNNFELARELGIMLAATIVDGRQPLPEAVLPVPLHPLRTLTRGYNQAREIADVVANELNLPVENGLIKRIRYTRPQFNLDPAARRRNLKGAFRLTRPPEYRSIALVDDIVTTGTTVNEIAALLKRSGVNSVYVWACARAG